MLRIGISGACGRMGRRIALLALKDPALAVSAALESPEAPDIGKDLGAVLGKEALGTEIVSDAGKICRDIDCLIEFTLPAPTLEHVEICRKNKVSMVIGTTGLDGEGEKRIAEAAAEIPVVFSPNMAPGVNLLFNIAREASGALCPDFSAKIDETHHVHKKDSPSGTARMIARIIAETAGTEPPIEASREGEVIGNHGIVFESEYEKLEIRHDAKSRNVFAAGAIRAAKFLAGKKNGLYNMADVLGLR